MSSAHGDPAYPRQAGELHKSDYIVMKDVYPCKVTEITTSKTGKHGSAKCSITAYDIFTGKRYEDSCPSTHNIMAPYVTKNDYLLVNLDEEYASYLDEHNVEAAVRLPPETEDLHHSIRAAFEAGAGDVIINVQRAMGIESIMDFRVDVSSK